MNILGQNFFDLLILLMKNNFSHKITSYIKELSKSALVKNILTVGIVTLFIKGVGFYKELLIAGNFGLSMVLDTFFIAMLVPGFIMGVFINSYLKVFIPNYIIEIKNNGDIRGFQTSSFIITVIIAVFFMLLTYLFTDVFLENFFSGHEKAYYDLIKSQLTIILPCLVIWAISVLLKGLLNVDNEFFYSSLSSLLMPLGTIISLLFFKDIFNESVLAMGVLIGSCSELLLLLVVTKTKKLVFLGYPDFVGSNIKQLLNQIPAKISSSLINSSNTFVDQYFSAQLVVGSIAALNYGWKIPSLAIGLITMALGSVLLPYFSNLAVSDIDTAFIKLKKILRGNFLLCISIAIVLFLLSHPIVTMVYERKAFTAENSNVVYKIQQMYVLLIPFYVVGVIMNRFLTAINKNNFLVLSSLISLILNIVLNYILVEEMGVFGLALATSFVSIINSIVIYSYILHLKKNRYV